MTSTEVNNFFFLLMLVSCCQFFCLQALKRSEQNTLLEMYKARLPYNNSSGHNNEVQRNNQVNVSPMPTTSTPEVESSRIRRLEKLIKKRL